MYILNSLGVTKQYRSWSKHTRICALGSPSRLLGVVAFRLIAFRLIAPTVGSTTEPQPKSN